MSVMPRKRRLAVKTSPVAMGQQPTWNLFLNFHIGISNRNEVVAKCHGNGLSTIDRPKFAESVLRVLIDCSFCDIEYFPDLPC